MRFRGKVRNSISGKESRGWWAHRSDRAHSVTNTLHALSLGMLWSKEYKLDFLARNLSQSAAAPNSDEPLTLEFMVFRYFETKRKNMKCSVKCVWSPLNQLSVNTLISIRHRLPLNCSDFSFDLFPTELAKEGTKKRLFSTRCSMRRFQLTCCF